MREERVYMGHITEFQDNSRGGIVMSYIDLLDRKKSIQAARHEMNHLFTGDVSKGSVKK